MDLTVLQWKNFKIENFQLRCVKVYDFTEGFLRGNKKYIQLHENTQSVALKFACCIKILKLNCLALGKHCTFLTFNNSCNTIKVMDCSVGDRTNDRLWELCLNCDSFLLLFICFSFQVSVVGRNYIYVSISIFRRFRPPLVSGQLRGCRTGLWFYFDY